MKPLQSLMLGACLVIAGVSSAHANSLVGPVTQSGIAQSSLSATPDGEWNRLSRREGAHVETWTRDGTQLNKVAFFGGIAPGSALYRNLNRKQFPLPTVTNNMLLTDIPTLLETTYRNQYHVNRISIDTQDVTTLDGHDAIRFTYSYVQDEDEVERKGEAVGSIVKGNLYLVTYDAPKLHFFDKDLDGFHKIVETLKF